MIVQNYERFRQPLLFDGLQKGKIYPTDIDAVLEYKDILWIIVEVKHKGVPITCGQRLLM